MPPQESEPDGHYGRWKMEDCNRGSARVSRVGEAVSGSRTFSKIVSARRRNQHARRVRYPEKSVSICVIRDLRLEKEMPDRASLAIRHLVDVSNQTKTELCVTVVSLSLDFFRCRGLNGMSPWMIN